MPVKSICYGNENENDDEDDNGNDGAAINC